MKMHAQARRVMGTRRCPICGALVKNEPPFVKIPRFDFLAEPYLQSIEPALDEKVFPAGTPICRHHQIVPAIGEP